ncbi:hypothetical protein LEP1GSC166_1538 [Leptospira kirschneri]|nr:hypothetical protein LEP1GSC166_1538 [Leptospira kirschneri]
MRWSIRTLTLIFFLLIFIKLSYLNFYNRVVLRKFDRDSYAAIRREAALSLKNSEGTGAKRTKVIRSLRKR